MDLSVLASALRINAGPAFVPPGEVVTASLVPPSSGNLTDVEGLANTLMLNGGVLGNVTGLVPVPTELPVLLNVEWKVTDESGNSLSEGTDFLAPNGMGAADAAFIFAPQVLDLTVPLQLPPPVLKLLLHAHVTISQQGSPVANIDLPPVPVFVAALLLPTVLVLCQHAFFHGQAVIVVPYDSPITSIELLKNVLESLDAVAVKLSPLKDFSSLLLAMRGITVALALPAVFVATSPNHKNGIPHLNEISLPDKVSANDRMSSLIFMGGGKSRGATLLPRKVECFRNHAYGTGEGYFIVLAERGMSALIYNFRDTPLWSVPVGRVTVCKGEAFNDKLSSVRFDYGSNCPTAT